MVQLNVGDTYTGRISRLSGSGSGVVEMENSVHIIIGPVKAGSVGKEVEFELIHKNYAYCKTESVKLNCYNKVFKKAIDDLGGRVQNRGRLLELIKQSKMKSFQRSGEKLEEKTDSTAPSPDLPQGNSAETELIEDSKNRQEDHGEMDSISELEELRDKAENESVEETPTDSITISQTTKEYTRSRAVAEYVKRRANGVCEGCGDPAPFISQTGDPYLHAHHIHELSDGGSDTVDTVIALCPNCHYRVHHGRDGEAYNDEYLEKIKAIEDN